MGLIADSMVVTSTVHAFGLNADTAEGHMQQI